MGILFTKRVSKNSLNNLPENVGVEVVFEIRTVGIGGYQTVPNKKETPTDLDWT